MKDRDRRHERVKWGKQIKCSKRITSQTIKKVNMTALVYLVI